MLEFSSQNELQDVLVTGLGLVTPLGLCAEDTWKSLIAGQRAGRTLGPMDIDHRAELGQIEGLKLHGAPIDYSMVREKLGKTSFLQRVSADIAMVWRNEPMVAMSLVALDEALEQCGLPCQSLIPERTAVVYGSSKGGLRSTEQMATTLTPAPLRKLQQIAVGARATSRPPRREITNYSDLRQSENPNPELWNCGVLPDSATRAVSAVTGAQVAGSCPVAACATGLIAFLQGAALIHRGDCDVCIVGSADAGLRASVLASFHRLRVTSRSSDASSACRPFDESRDGFLIGEGAAVGILESRAHAEARGATPIARIVAGGWLNDPTGITQIDESGDEVYELLQRTLTSKNRRPDFINLHGTGTISNDLAEARGVSRAFGESGPMCFGVKGAMGHLLGAAGSTETALTLLALRHRKIPGTTNLRRLDPRCGIQLQSTTSELTTANTAAKLSLGFGGHLACGFFDCV